MTSKSTHLHSVGQLYHDFKVTEIKNIPELSCQLIELEHLPSGAKIMHIGNEDPENLFCLSFQTIPTTSDGVAHILEHTVLCGSKKFPVKDPFFAMQRRSLNTFMNALTGADFTCYPAATQVHKDFYNLLDVYLDAVFYPNLNELSFLQEGHRLEFSTPDDANTPLEYKGIVFNEMKGVLTSPTNRLNEAISRELLPDLTYGINSGGDPKVIPDLTYEQLKQFHKNFYHPSRCLFFFYGNMPLEPHLDFIATHVLNHVEPLEPLAPLPLQKRFTEPRRITENYPVSADEDTYDKSLIAFGWLTCHVLDQEDLLALSILEIILMDTDASPLKMALLKSGLCKQALCYMDDEMSEVPIVVLIKGCNAESAEDLESLIFKTLKNFVREGIELSLIENAIHQLEFHRSEITGDHTPFGLSLFMRSALLKQHGGDPLDGLKIHSLFDNIRRKNLENPQYLTDLVEKYFINNPHFVRISLVPDKTLAERELNEEKETLKAIQKALSSKEKEEIVKRAATLATFQQKQEDEDIDVLPQVTLHDVPHAPRIYPLNQENVGALNVFHHNCFTNEIVYADLVFNLPPIPEEDLPYVRLFTSLLSQMGCNGRNYAQNLDYIQANTGGVGASLTLNLQANDHTTFTPSIYIRGKALTRKIDKLFPLLHEMVTSVNFNDKSRLKEVILKQYTALQGSINQNALKYAINLSADGLDIPSKIANAWYGIEYFWKIKALATNFDQLVDWLIAKMESFKVTLIGLGTPDLILSSDAVIYDTMKRQGFYGLADIEVKPGKKWTNQYNITPPYSQGRVIASPVAFTGQVLSTVSYTHHDAPALNIASFLLDNITLHSLIREQGGAYGSGAVSNAMSGSFYFYSYRDPNISSTLKAFEQSINDIINKKFDETDLEESKLEMVQTLDNPIAPGSRADIAYGWLREGKTTEVRQNFRDRVLSLTENDVVKALEIHVLPKLSSAATVVFSSRELLEKENIKLVAEGKKPLPIENI